MSTQEIRTEEEFFDASGKTYKYSTLVEYGYEADITVEIYIDDETREFSIDEKTIKHQTDEMIPYEMHTESSQITTRKYDISNVTDRDEFVMKYKKIFDSRKADRLLKKYEIKELEELKIILDCIDFDINYRKKED